MSKKVRNLEDFIEKAAIIHNKKYGYLKSVYTGCQGMIIINCPVEGHGDFLQTASDHLTGRGCSKCAGNKKYTTNEFIIKANEIHNNKYEYLKTVYVRNSDNVIITCKIHGDFSQSPNLHLSGSGCKKCAQNSRAKTIEKFIQEANIIHNFTYDYSLFDYKTKRIKSIIICKIHGNFLQTSDSHLSGKGCPDCGKEKSSLATYSNKFFINHPEMKNKKAILYIVKFIYKTDVSEFYKIGISQNTINRRFNDTGEFYLIEEIFILNTNLFNAYYLEQKYLKEIRKTQVRPRNTILKNKGESECFFADKNFVNNLIENICNC